MYIIRQVLHYCFSLFYRSSMSGVRRVTCRDSSSGKRRSLPFHLYIRFRSYPLPLFCPSEHFLTSSNNLLHPPFMEDVVLRTGSLSPILSSSLLTAASTPPPPHPLHVHLYIRFRSPVLIQSTSASALLSFSTFCHQFQ
jgi:hypothetical protein